MRKLLLSTIATVFLALTANAQYKLFPSGKVSVGTTQEPASTLSVNSVGNSGYDAYVNGNCKVDSGFVSANVFQPSSYPGWTSRVIRSDVMERLMALTTAMYTQPAALQGMAGDGSLPEETDEMQDERGLKPTPLYAHFAITNMDSLFLLQANTGFSGRAVNYSELVPLLVYGFQDLIQQIFPNHQGNVLDDILPPAEEESQAEISFQLPLNAQDARIFLFDRTGMMLEQIPLDASMAKPTVRREKLPEGTCFYSLIVNGQEVNTKRIAMNHVNIIR